MRWVFGISAAVLILAGVWCTRHAEPKASLKPIPVEKNSLKVPSTTPAEEMDCVSEVSLEKVADLLQQAKKFSKAKDIRAYARVIQDLTALGVKVAPFLLQVLEEGNDPELMAIAASVLGAVGDIASAPRSLRVLLGPVPSEVKMALIRMLARLKFDGADEAFRVMLFDSSTDARLRPVLLEYYGALGGERALGVADRVLKSDLRELYLQAGELLVKNASPQAAAILLDAWARIYGTSRSGDASHYQLLALLGKFDPAIVKDIFDTHLAREQDLSKKNFLISVLARMDSSFSLMMVRRVLISEKDYRVRQQAIMVLGQVNTLEAQEMLLSLLIQRGHPADTIEAMNSLFSQSTLLVDRVRVQELFVGEQNLGVRLLLGNLLTRYDGPMEVATREDLRRLAEDGLKSQEEGVRANSVQLLASLAQYQEDPVGSLVQLREGLPDANKHPYVLMQLAKFPDDRTTKVFADVLRDESAERYERLIAAQYLVEHDRTRAYEVLKTTKNVDLAMFIAASAVEKGGTHEIPKISEIARAMPEDEKKNVILLQVKAWEELRPDR